MGECLRFCSYPLLMGDAGLRRMSESLQLLLKSPFRIQGLNLHKFHLHCCEYGIVGICPVVLLCGL